MSTATATSPPNPALRVGLPFGFVMATGAASQLAGLCGEAWALKPLLWLAVAAAVWITGYGAFRHRAQFRAPLSTWTALGPPAQHGGVLTVPLGLAVVSTGLAGQTGGFAAAVATVGLVLAWLAVLVFVPRFVASVSRTRRLSALDGSWFLAPAVLLGVAISNVAFVPHEASTVTQDWLRFSALTAAILGALGYWTVLAAAAVRVARYRLGGARPVLWWIWAGCGGLAATSMSKAIGASGSHWDSTITAILRPAVAVTWTVAAVLIVPILLLGARFMITTCKYQQHALWPPTFSSAVFALGGLAAGKLLASQTMSNIGKYAGYLTLIFWVVTATWNLTRLARARRAGDRNTSGAAVPASQQTIRN